MSYYLLYQYFQLNCHYRKICRYFVGAFINLFKINWRFRMITCFCINILRFSMCLFSNVFSINRLFNFVIDLIFFLTSSRLTLASSLILSESSEASSDVYSATTGSSVGSLNFKFESIALLNYSILKNI